MGESLNLPSIPLPVYLGFLLLELLFIGRALLRPHRDPTSRLAWVAVIAIAPLVGMLAYLLVGETSIGRRRAARARAIQSALPPFPAYDPEDPGFRVEVPERYELAFRTGASVSGFEPIGGNAARLFSDSDASIEAMVADVDAAREHVHLLTYIWLVDGNGLKLASALERAARRGVSCRVLADGMGSRGMIRSSHWKSMRTAGVQVATALAIGNPVLRPLHGRIDLRNHRKILVVDDSITYCGSQNCADPEFRVKARFAPWVDAVMRFEGPVARQNQFLFACDWMEAVDEDLSELLVRPLAPAAPGIGAQVVGTGPTARDSAMPELFEALMASARRKIVITTPYYVPNESMQDGLCAAAYRGIDTTLVLPARNDSRIVACASRSYYAELLAAGVKLHEYQGGLLHTKSFTVDDELTLIGSANMDRRSFDLNYENNVLFHDAELTAAMHRLQEEYMARSRPVSAEEVAAWGLARRLWNNALALLGPLL